MKKKSSSRRLGFHTLKTNTMKTVANIMQLIVQNKLFKEKITFLKSVLNIFDQKSYILLKKCINFLTNHQSGKSCLRNRGFLYLFRLKNAI